MKKNTLILATLAMAAVLTTSCKKEETRIITLQNPTYTNAKTHVIDNVSHWDFGETLKIKNGNSLIEKSVINYGGYPAVSLEKSDFGGSFPPNIFGGYAGDYAEINGTTLTGIVFNVGGSYSVSQDIPNNLPLFGSVMGAVENTPEALGNELMSFQHIFSYIRLHGTFAAGQTVSISVNPNYLVPINGSYIAYNNFSVLQNNDNATDANYSNIYTVANAGSSVILPIMAGTYGNLSITVGGVTKTAAEIELVRGTIYDLTF